MRDTAYEILSALRLGSVPAIGVVELAVGRQAELEELEHQLDFSGQGKSALKFISGDFGSGKSFLCALLRERAFEKGFASSAVIVSPDTPLGKLDVITGKTFDGLRLPEKRTGCGLSDLLEKWLLDLLKKISMLEGLSLGEPKATARLHSLAMDKIQEELSAVRGLEASFANAIKSYLQARLKRDNQLASDVLGWLKGNRNLAASRKNQIGIKGDITPLFALNYIKGLLTILRSTGAAGLVWIIDEVETVQRLPNSRQRENSFESLRILVDQIAENAFPGLMLIVTGTPQLFEDPRYGIPSYEALKERINRISFPNGSYSFRQPILTLRGFNFDLLLQVAERIRKIHGLAFAWNPEERLTDDHIRRFAELAVSAFGGHVERTPRVFLREVVNLCDMLHEHPNLSADEYFRDDKILAARLTPPGSNYAESIETGRSIP
jgi:adenosylhomocysteinase